MRTPSIASLSAAARLVASGLFLSGCIELTPPGTSFASDPPGARVLVDGRDSGRVTPCLIALDPDGPHRVEIELPGHEPRALELVPMDRHWFVSWAQGAAGMRSTTQFPLLLPIQDFLVPLRWSRTASPARVFVRLYPGTEP
jgi:hypothetical protein